MLIVNFLKHCLYSILWLENHIAINYLCVFVSDRYMYMCPLNVTLGKSFFNFFFEERTHKNIIAFMSYFLVRESVEQKIVINGTN